ncbi:MAG TPA: hypothetical protein VJS64_15145 [Pyrinomonadaceae bacterium]|nr:hypothetical protein [Pyrinomonadaceae bacterium]
MKALETYGEMIKEADAFVRELDETIRLAAFNWLMAEERNVQPITGEVVNVMTPEQTRTLSPQELIHLCGVTSLMDKALVLAYWLEEQQGSVSFTSADLKNAFLSAREPAPVNPSDVVAKLESARKLMKGDRIGKAQAYRLTGTAISEVKKWMQAET